MKIIAAIELNDSSHDRADRKRIDELVRAVMLSAKLPLIEIKAAKTYNLTELKSAVDMAINTPGHNALSHDKPVQENTRSKNNPHFANDENLQKSTQPKTEIHTQ